MVIKYTGKEKRVKAWVIKKGFYFVFIAALKFIGPERLDF
jgi:hypothetical protein